MPTAIPFNGLTCAIPLLPSRQDSALQQADTAAGPLAGSTQHVRRNTLLCCAIAGLLGLGLLVSLATAAAAMTLPEKRGRTLYLKTVSPAGRDITAIVGQGEIEAPGSALACVNCHAPDGRGLDEHGIRATDVTWQDLTKAYRIDRDKGRAHPPYTEEALRRAITEGVDPAGNVLDRSMPRYRMAAADLDDLIAYLKVIATALDPGLSATTVKVGTLVPRHGPLGAMGQEVQRLLEAFFADVNQAGGIYNRRMELLTVDDTGAPERTVAALRRLITEEEVFAIVAPFISGADAQAAADLAEDQEVPMIGPFTLYPVDPRALQRFTFYLLAGLREQARVQVLYAGRRLAGAGHRTAVIYPENETPMDMVEAVEQQNTAGPGHALRRRPYAAAGLRAAALAEDLKRSQTAALYFLGPWADLRALLAAAEGIDWYPLVFVTGSQVQGDLFSLPQGFGRRLFITYPTLPSDQTPAGREELARLFRKHGLARRHLAAQISAYCAGKILLEGLKLAGGRPSREKLVSALETFEQFDTGLSPRITYDANRRIGALGAHVITVDPAARAFVPLDGWIPLE